VSRERAILDNAVEYAVELGHLSGNPISSTKWRAPKTTEAVNPRVVINHGQGRALLAAVGKQESGRALVAFFGVMYYAALRPSEAVDLRKEALSLPKKGWGELYLSTSAPSAGRSWSESGTRREPRQLKHRGVDEVRIVLGRTQCRRPASGLRQVHLGSGGRGAAAGGVGSGSPLSRRGFAAYLPQTPAEHRPSPDITGHDENGP
jgi:hypothetical protein